MLKEAVMTIFTPPGTAGRICKDEDGALQQLIVAAVLAQETRHWTEEQLTKFPDSIQGPQYNDFRKIYAVVKEEAGYLIAQGDTVKQLAAERKKARDRRKAAKSGRGNEDKNKIFGGDGSPDIREGQVQAETRREAWIWCGCKG
jgi:hypothetical protein